MKRTTLELKQVLVGTDFSESAHHALDRVAMLPLERNPTVTVLHVLPDGVARSPEIERTVRKALEAEAGTLQRAARQAGRRDVTVRTVLGRGRAFVETVRTAKELSADLVVLGRVGERKLRDVLLGSTAERVVREAATPVLLVGRKPTAPYRAPAAAVDPFERLEPIVSQAIALAGPEATRIELMHAADLPEYGMLVRGGATPDVLRDYREEARRRARTALDAALAALRLEGSQVSAVLRTGDPRKLVPKWVEQRRFDLLALGTHRRRGLARVLLGSVAGEVMRRVSCDTLIVPVAGSIVRRT